MNKGKFRIICSLVGCLLWVGPQLSLSQESTVFVGNEQMIIDRASGAVSVIQFIRLLDEAERGKVKYQGTSLLVTDSDGTPHLFELDNSRQLADWERALGLLGYVRKVNRDTGVVDFRLASAGAELDEAPELEPEAVRLERSLRRPGYLKAQDSYRKIMARIPRSNDEEARRRVDRLGQRVALYCPLSGLKWNFDVIETHVPNALCTGEGHVLVTTGLLDLNLTDDELGGVLGHEVAHGVRRHTQIFEERFNEFVSLRQELLTLSAQYDQATDSQDKYSLQRIKSRVDEKKRRYDFLLTYLKNKRDYDQDEEEEADVLGMQYAVAAGFDSEGEARALIKLKKRSVELFGQSYGEGNRTHPPLDRRLEILRLVRSRWK